MKQVKLYWNLLRGTNLLFIAIIQWLVFQSVIIPVLATQGVVPATGKLQFIFTILATVLICAGGNIINDYFDTRIDEINKPEKVIIGKSISRREAMLLHQFLTFSGVLLGLIVAVYAKSYLLGVIYILVPGLLWFYSSSYKRMFVAGNFVVATLSGLVPLLIGITEKIFLERKYGDKIIDTGLIGDFMLWVLVFSFFAFLTTLTREIVKDIEDEPGDRELECATLPIVLGIRWAKAITLLLMALILIIVIGGYIKYFGFNLGEISFIYVILFITVPVLYAAYLLVKAKDSRDFRFVSSLIKIIMMAGILFSVVFYILLAKATGIPFFNIYLI